MATIDRATAVQWFKALRGDDYEKIMAILKCVADSIVIDDAEYPSLFAAIAEQSGAEKFKPDAKGEFTVPAGRYPTSEQWLVKPDAGTAYRNGLMADLVRIIKL